MSDRHEHTKRLSSSNDDKEEEEEDMYDPETSIEDYQKMLSERQKSIENKGKVTDEVGLTDEVGSTDSVGFTDNVGSTDIQVEEKEQSASFREILSQIQELVLMSADTMNAELEVHIGRIKQQGGFDSQVSEVHFTTLLERFEQAFAEKSVEWERMEEFVFPNKGRAPEVRLRRNPDGVAKFIQKTNIHRHQVEMKDGMYDFSIVLNSEHASHINYGLPRYLRFKERKTFRDGDFAYTFTKVWPMSFRESYGSSTKQKIDLARWEAERDATLRCDNDKNRPTFEVELELCADWSQSAKPISSVKSTSSVQPTSSALDPVPVNTPFEEASIKERARDIAYALLIKIVDLVGHASLNQGKWHCLQFRLPPTRSQAQRNQVCNNPSLGNNDTDALQRHFPQPQEQFSIPGLSTLVNPPRGATSNNLPVVQPGVDSRIFSTNNNNGGSNFPFAISSVDKFYQDIALAEAAKQATSQAYASLLQQSMQYSPTPLSLANIGIPMDQLGSLNSTLSVGTNTPNYFSYGLPQQGYLPAPLASAQHLPWTSSFATNSTIPAWPVANNVPTLPMQSAQTVPLVLPPAQQTCWTTLSPGQITSASVANPTSSTMPTSSETQTLSVKATTSVEPTLSDKSISSDKPTPSVEPTSSVTLTPSVTPTLSVEPTRSVPVVTNSQKSSPFIDGSNKPKTNQPTSGGLVGNGPSLAKPRSGRNMLANLASFR